MGGATALVGGATALMGEPFMGLASGWTFLWLKAIVCLPQNLYGMNSNTHKTHTPTINFNSLDFIFGSRIT